jgi:hypothetical protein
MCNFDFSVEPNFAFVFIKIDCHFNERKLFLECLSSIVGVGKLNYGHQPNPFCSAACLVLFLQPMS